MRIHPSVRALAFSVACFAAVPANAASLRFHGFGAGDVDRVKIPIDDVSNPNDEPGPPVDVGASDFTIEFWIRGTLADNSTGLAQCGGEGWIYGNIVLDRDRWQPGGRDFGISLGEGRVVFGVANPFESETVCGAAQVLDGAWHHVAVDRRFADGRMRVFVDGEIDAEMNGPDGDISYPGGETPQGNNCNGGPCVNSDPFVVLGAEKHDAGSEFPSFDGFLDELRFSNVLRYAGSFTPPVAPFTSDATTAALYHFDEGSGDFIGDTSGATGGPSHGLRRFGGTPVPGPEWSAESPFAPATTAEVVKSPSSSEPATKRTKKPSFEAHPNPSLGQTLFFARTAEPLDGAIAISIVDVAGREAARIGGTLARGSALVVWDGRDEKGKPLVAGVYFAKLSGAGEEVVEKIVVR